MSQYISTKFELTKGERAIIWRDAAYDSLECVKATFLRHEFAPHAHDTFVVGAVVSGDQRHKLKGTESIGGPGSVFMLNPKDLHDGRPLYDGYSDKMFYPSVSLMDEIARELPGNNRAVSLS